MKIRAYRLGRPVAGKTGTTNDFTDAWFMGFTPTLTAGVWVGNDDKQISLGKKETGAMAALPIWIEFMQTAMEGTPVQDFPNVIPLDKQSGSHYVTVDTPDLAPTEPSEQGLPIRAAPPADDAEGGTVGAPKVTGNSTTPAGGSTTAPAGAKPDSKEPPKKPGRGGPGTPQ